jgi:alkanesulfonate monooxygenase SsuD/methylene tetrahydromethanopterin reductase-like flavin-dependent oxidoreductase (luciferase family)/putative sterol carrier protein
MRFGIFYEHQLPRPWDPASEHRLLQDALEQIELADKSGIDYVWEVEHHFLEEYSHSSAPEVFLAAASQRTSKIRLGHGIVQAPALVNHPARIAERIATLDLVSNGRVEFGTGEASSASELGGFGVPRDAKRAMWEESLDAVTRMLVEEPFAGYDGTYMRMPPRNVVPKPLQRPHPPLWVACSRRETIHLAARSGVGALSFSFAEPEDAARWVSEYYRLIESDECVPRGFAVNPNVAIVLPMMLHPDEATAIERGIDGAHFFGYSLGHFYGAQHLVGGTDLWSSFGAERAEHGFAREIIAPTAAPLAVRLLEAGLGSLRGAIGTPDQVSDLVARYEQAGVDQVMFVMQAGKNSHEHICESIELFAKAVLPRFAEGRQEKEDAKAERLADATERALTRRAGPRTLSAPYLIDETRENAWVGLPAAGHAPAGLRQLSAGAGALAVGTVRKRARSGARRAVGRASDQRLEQIFGSAGAQRALFAMMASRFQPDRAAGFSGAICYELRQIRETRRPGGVSRAWTIEVTGEHARVREGKAVRPAVTIAVGLADFIRLVTGATSPFDLIAAGTLAIEGDMAVAARLGDMFGGESAY